MKIHHMGIERKTIAKTIAVLTAGALGFAGCNWVVGDEYPHPLAGKVGEVGEPSLSCSKYGCHYNYYLYIDGCVELSDAAKQYVADKGREPEKGWVEVDGNTWSHAQRGDEMEFAARDFIQRLFADQNDDNHPC